MELTVRKLEPAVLTRRVEASALLWAKGSDDSVLAKDVIVLGALLSLLQLVDGVLTNLGINRYGIAIEGNPFLRSMMEEFGHVPTLTILKCLAIGLVIALTMMTKKLPWIKNAMSAVTAVYLFAAILPWTYLLFIKPYI